MLNLLPNLSGLLTQTAVALHLLSVALASPAVYEIPAPTSTGPVFVSVKEYQLSRIFYCESGNKQFNKDGSVVKNSNKNKTTDWGLAQINDIHLPVAQKLGLDIINSRKDNEVFAGILYDKFGPKIWYGWDAKRDKCSWE